MHKLLHRFLQKKGINSPDELDNTKMPDGSPSERETFENWRRVLDKDDLEISDVRSFCEYQLSRIETKWSDYDTSQDKKAELLPYFTVYKTLIRVLDSPKDTRTQLEDQLNNLIG